MERGELELELESKCEDAVYFAAYSCYSTTQSPSPTTPYGYTNEYFERMNSPTTREECYYLTQYSDRELKSKEKIPEYDIPNRIQDVISQNTDTPRRACCLRRHS